mgnify:CR=1 FL=1
MSYTALYRKWRPASFEDVKGQDHIVKIIKKVRWSQAGLATPTCFAAPGEPERPVSRRFLPERSTANIRRTEARAMNAKPVSGLKRALP